MKNTVEIKKNIAHFEITLTGKELNKYLEMAIEEKIKTLDVDGFRKGKMPKAMFIKKYGVEGIYPEAIDLVLNDTYSEVVTKNELNVVAAPEIDWASLNIDKTKGFSAKGTVELMPEVIVEDYKKIHKEVKKAEVKIAKKEITDKIKSLIEHKAIMKVKKGAAKKGDTVVIDFEGFVGKEAFGGGKGENHPLELGSNSFIPGFEEQLIGASAGEEVEVEVTFPKEYQSADLAGKNATFKCLVHEVKAKKIPKLDEEMISELKQYEANTQEELEKEIEKELIIAKESEVKNKFHEDVMKKLIKATKIKVPTSIIKQETDYTLDQFKSQLEQQGIQIDMYMQMTGMTEEVLRADIDKDSKRKLEEMMIMNAIIKAEDIKVTESEVKEKIKEIADANKTTQKEVKERLGDLTRLNQDMVFEKAYKLVLGE